MELSFDTRLRMPSVYDLKPRFQALLRPLTKILAKYGVTANHITILAAVLSIATGLYIVNYSESPSVLIVVPIILFVRMALNAIDGMLAREHQMKSSLGALLNELGDVISDLALYLPFALVFRNFAELIVTINFLALLTEFTGVLGLMIGASRRYDGPMGKSDRAFAFGVIAILHSLHIDRSNWIEGILVLIAAGSVLTIIGRARKALKETKP